MTTPTPAWLVFSDSQSFALAEKEMIEYITAPDCLSVPVTPAYASRVLSWRDVIIPVIDLRVLNGKLSDEGISSLVVVAYQHQPAEPLNYVALVITKAPVRVLVDDKQACDKPEDSHPLLQSVSMAYFTQDNEPVPVLDLKQLCSEDFLLSATR